MTWNSHNYLRLHEVRVWSLALGLLTLGGVCDYPLESHSEIRCQLPRNKGIGNRALHQGTSCYGRARLSGGKCKDSKASNPHFDLRSSSQKSPSDSCKAKSPAERMPCLLSVLLCPGSQLCLSGGSGGFSVQSLDLRNPLHMGTWHGSGAEVSWAQLLLPAPGPPARRDAAEHRLQVGVVPTYPWA